MKFEPAPKDLDFDRAKDLVDRLGWNTTCYQILNQGIERQFCADPEALVGYVRRGHCRVVAGAPVCRSEDAADVLRAWEEHSAEAGDKVCCFGAERRFLQASRELGGHSEVILGSQPVWDTSRWPEAAAHHASFRAQLNRARNKGVAVEEWPPEKAQNHPELNRILSEWLSTRGLPPMHFMVEPHTLPNLEGRRVFVAVRNERPTAFLTLSPIPRRNGFLTEQFPRGREAVNGTVELLMDTGIKAITASGAKYLTMGIVPLSKRHEAVLTPEGSSFHETLTRFEVPVLGGEPNPAWLNLMMKWVRAHGRRFYNFDGLDAFKSKFMPHAWEPIYAISNEPKFSMGSLVAIAAAFSDGPLTTTAVRALGRAVKKEVHWLVHPESRPQRRKALNPASRALK